MPVFNDSENKVSVLHEEGDYIYRVAALKCGVSAGGKTNGSDTYELSLLIEKSGGTVFETLIDHDATAWKIDVFLKSAGVTIPNGAAFEFDRERAENVGVRWVNAVGLRGWCKLGVETVTDRDGKPKMENGKPKLRNRVAVFYTDREKLAPFVETRARSMFAGRVSQPAKPAAAESEEGGDGF
jgi:hypothetical protein